MNRFAGLAGVAVLAALFTLGTIWWMKRPVMFPGDRLESRTCRDCGGSGVMGDYVEGEPDPGMPAEDGPCVTCGGRGQVQVILPGPSHPTWVKGSVVDDEAGLPGYLDGPAMPGKAVPGAVAGAALTFRREDQEVEVHSAPSGRFRVQLPPGVWKVDVEAAGFAPWTGRLEVPVLTFPIYLEEARVVRPPEHAAQEQAEHGLPLQIRLRGSSAAKK